MSESHEIGRRDFVKAVLAFLGTIMGGIVGIPAIGYLIDPATKVQKAEDWISLGPPENYALGVPTLFSFTRTKINGWERTVNSYGVYVVCKSESETAVYSNMCTHLSCRVTWQEGAQEYVCPCHDAHFGPDGEVISGPPPKPLIAYQTKLEEGNLLFFFEEA